MDQELDTIRGLLSGPDPLSKSLERELGSQSQSFGAAGDDHDQKYDQFVRELIFDQRSKPKDRTKTEEELALEAKISLEKAERQRIRRMNGDNEAESSGEEGRPAKRRRLIGGDDLGDDFDDADDWDGLGEGLRSNLDNASEEGGSVDDSGDEDSDASDDETGAADDSEPPWYGLSNVIESKPSGMERSGRQVSTNSKELPYTFPCPSSHEEFLDITEGIADQDIPTVVERIRALHHPSLGVENPSRLQVGFDLIVFQFLLHISHKTLQVFTGVLIDHILHVASLPNMCLTVVSGLLLHLRALTRAYPRQTAEHFTRKLLLMHKNLKRGLHHGASDDDAKTWPGLPELVFLRVLGVLWPTSDMHHVVVSPARLLMGSYLGLCRIRCFVDAASGLFLCTLFLQYERRSKRFVPEVVNFLIDVVRSLSPWRGDFNGSTRRTPLSQRHNYGQLCVLNTGEARTLTMNQPHLVAILGGKGANIQTNTDLLGLAIDLLARFSELYRALEGFVELYEPVLQVLRDVDSDVLCPVLQVNFQLISIDILVSNFIQGPNLSNHRLYPEALEVLPPGPPASTPPITQAYPNSVVHSEV